jgi:TonB-dependent receptor
MKSSARQRGEKRLHGQRNLPALTVTARCVALLFVSAGTAFAQDAKPVAQSLETVTITGIRRGIEAAISVKKNSTSIVEAVSAEDIGKLPDNSIAESIARLPGLAAQRVGGRAQVISVRGLSPDFATTLLNGRELVSTGDNRSVEFDQYPSELLSGVTIYKTPDAGWSGQGLSGTIDMQTVRPLNFRRPHDRLRRPPAAQLAGCRRECQGHRQPAQRELHRPVRRSHHRHALGVAHTETPIQENQTGLYEPWEVQPRVGRARRDLHYRRHQGLCAAPARSRATG